MNVTGPSNTPGKAAVKLSAARCEKDSSWSPSPAIEMKLKINYVYVFLKVYYRDRSLLDCLSVMRYVLPAKRQVPPHAHWLNMRCQHAAVPWKNSFHKNKNKNFLQPSDVMHSIPSVRLYMLVYRGAAVNPKRGCFRDPKEELIDPGGTEIRKRSDTLCPRLSSC